MTVVGRNRAFGYSYFNCAHWRLTSELASKLLPLQPHADSLSAYSSYNYSYPHGSLTLLAFDRIEYKTIHLRTSFSLRNPNSTLEQEVYGLTSLDMSPYGLSMASVLKNSSDCSCQEMIYSRHYDMYMVYTSMYIV